jgi:hypothetical protein
MTKKLFTVLAVLIMVAFFASSGMATDTCPVGEDCGTITLPCVNCTPPTPIGPDELSKVFNVTAGGALDIKQVQDHAAKIEDCLIKIEVNTAQSISGIVQLPITDEKATGALSVTASQLNNVPSSTATVGNDTVTYLAQAFEKTVASASATYVAPEAKMTISQADTADIAHHDYTNGMATTLDADTCLKANMYGATLSLATQQINSFGFSASDPNGSWQSIVGAIQLNTGVMPTTAP